MAEAIAFNIITKLSSPVLQQLGLWWNFKEDLHDLKSIVSATKAVLLDAEERSVTSNLVKDCLEKMKDALYDMDDLLDDIHTDALWKDRLSGNKLSKEVHIFFSSSNQFAYGVKMGHKIKAIKSRLMSIESETKMLNLVKHDRPHVTSVLAKRRQQTHSFVRKGEIIGRDEDKAALLKLMFEFQSEQNVFIIPIVGFGGLGKTALAQLVYNDEMVKDQFELRIWVCVSDVFDVKIIVGNIIKSVTNQAPHPNLEMDQLQKQLRDKIDGKKYFLVLDDIWNEEWEQWTSLKRLLMGGAEGSRIIVTTRSRKVSKIASKCNPHVVKGLPDDDAWFLFKEIAFEQRPTDSTNPAFLGIGKQILEKCGGVPLVIRTIAGTLSYKGTEREWLSFKDNELARISHKQSEILPALRLSYEHLPSHLKHCFAYCRLYPKDHKIGVRTLVQLWIAQGFVIQSSSSVSLEEIGFGYFEELVERSFVQEVAADEDLFLTCKMHDLMHDLAELVAGTESCILDSNSSVSEIDEKCRHIAIDFSSVPSFKGKKLRTLLCSSNNRVDDTMDVTWNSIISNYRSLRVLELNRVYFNTVPHSIHKLKHLRYLDLSNNNGLKVLPESICKIENLQVLKLTHCKQLKELPKKIEKLVNLTHLPCFKCKSLTHMPRGIGKLTSLQTLSEFVVDRDGSHGAAAADLSELTGLNNLRGGLIIRNLGMVKNAKDKFRAANLKEKQHLQSLMLHWSGDPYDNDKSDDDEKSLEDLQPHPNLKRLYVRGWRGDAKFPPWISSLINLVDIRISAPSKFKYLPSFAQLPHLQNSWISELTELEYMDDSDLNGDSESFFPSLKILSLEKCTNMKSWWRKRPVDDDNYKKDGTVIRTSSMTFPCLSNLHIVDCPLSSMPLYPSLRDELRLVNTSSRPLKQTIQMNIKNKTPSSSTSSLPLSKLKSFRVENIEELDADMLHECLQNMASLENLDIVSCLGLKSLSGWSQQQLTSLKSLTIRDCKELDLEDMQLEPLKNLSSFTIDNIPRLVSLPIWLQHLTKLRHLYLVNLPNLTSLPDEMRCLTTLKQLYVKEVPELEERCRKDIGADWHKIAHIPNIDVNME